jgi:hypothetical protein
MEVRAAGHLICWKETFGLSAFLNQPNLQLHLKVILSIIEKIFFLLTINRHCIPTQVEVPLEADYIQIGMKYHHIALENNDNSY